MQHAGIRPRSDSSYAHAWPVCFKAVVHNRVSGVLGCPGQARGCRGPRALCNRVNVALPRRSGIAGRLLFRSEAWELDATCKRRSSDAGRLRGACTGLLWRCPPLLHRVCFLLLLPRALAPSPLLQELSNRGICLTSFLLGDDRSPPVLQPLAPPDPVARRARVPPLGSSPRPRR